jgi:hypothetical protein
MEKQIDFEKVLFRCSSLGHLMTEPKKKGEVLSETAKTHIRDIYISLVFGRNTDISNKYLIKGVNVEDDSITLYSTCKRVYFEKNEDHYSNGFIKGTPDIKAYEGMTADIKSRWDIYTFMRTIGEPMDKMNFWQITGYMWLQLCEKGSIVNALVNTPFAQIQNELRKENYQWPDGTPAWREIEIIKNSVYDFKTFNDYVNMVCPPQTDADKEMFDSFVEIEPAKRINEVTIESSLENIESIKTKIIAARGYMADFHKLVNLKKF